MKKFVLLLSLLMFTSPVMAAPNGGHGGVRGGEHVNHPTNKRPSAHITINRPTPMPRRVVYRAPIPRHIYRRPIPYYNAYYNGFYYYDGYPIGYYTSYDYYPSETTTYITQDGTTQVIVKRENAYAGINTAANVINAAANTATAIKLLSW